MSPREATSPARATRARSAASSGSTRTAASSCSRRRSRATRWPVPTTWRSAEPATGKLFVLDADGGGEMLAERPNVYPNGIAFDGRGRMYWTESMAHAVLRWDDGEVTTFCQLSDNHVPDGMAFAADGRLF